MLRSPLTRRMNFAQLLRLVLLAPVALASASTARAAELYANGRATAASMPSTIASCAANKVKS